MAKFIASQTPIIEIPSNILFANFAACPIPQSPQCVIRWPMHSSTFFTASYSPVEPPTIKVSVPFSAPITPPDTGASTNRAPLDSTTFLT